MDGSEKFESKSHTLPSHTREQVTKMSGVCAGTVARYVGQDMPIMAAGLTAKSISHTIKIGRRYGEMFMKIQSIEALDDMTLVAVFFDGAEKSTIFANSIRSCRN